MRPHPPELIFDLEGPNFVPAPDVSEWINETFIDEGSEIENPDHAHLQHATIGVLWTSVANARQGRSVIGQAEEGSPRAMGRWAKARAEQQVVEWFGEIPDFIITLDASYCAQASDIEFCALVDHELYHCAQDRDQYGAPKFRKDTGRPAFTMRGHDVEEFIGVVRRYGADAAGVRALVDAAAQQPTIARVSIAQACGTCLLRVA